MKKTILIAAMVAALFAPAAFGQSSDGSYGGSYSRMSFIKGEAYVQHGQDAGFEQGEVNLVVLEGDKIGTKSGRLEVQLGRRNYLRLGDFSQADIVTLPRSDGDQTKIHLLAGRAFVRIGTLDAEKRFEIHTPDASFYVLEAGLYRVEIRENRETEFAVFNGSAEASGEEGSVVVNEREQVTAANGRVVSGPSALLARNDELGEWNASRDAIYAKKVGRTYLPADYYDYEVELAENGRWANDSEYGDVWVPRVYSDWRPYYNGHWSWYPIIGWTWVSNDPWGWCTSHYGRWGWGLNLGWYWIPERHWGWGPAWVHWYWERDYIGWCPLSHWGYPAYVMNNRFYGRSGERFYPNGGWGMSVVRRDQFQNRRLSGAVLDRAGMNRLGNISLRNAQPDLRPNLGANADVAGRARQALSRDGLRSVSQGFSSGRRVGSESLRSNAQAGPARADGSSVRRSGSGASAGSGPVREIRSDSGAGTSRSLSRNGSAGAGQAERRVVERGTSLPPAGSNSGAAGVRSFPSRESGASSGRVVSSPSREGGAVSRSTGSGASGATSRVRESVGRDAVRSFPSRSNGGETGSPSSSVNRSSGRTIRSFGSTTGVAGSPSRSTSASPNINRSQSRSASASPNVNRSQSRSVNASPNFNRSQSRSASPSAPSYSAPSRSYSAPSRSYSAPSAPSRSYSAPSRSSGGFSSPSRSVSSPSRSSGSSYSAPSRSSSSGSSRSSSSSGGGSSRSSGSSSGGRVRR